MTQAINELQADLQPRIPNEEEIKAIERYAQQIREGADLASNDPAEQRKIYQTLQMEITLNYEPAEGASDKGQHWADFRCILGQDRLSTVFTTNRQNETAPASATAGAPEWFAAWQVAMESLDLARFA